MIDEAGTETTPQTLAPLAPVAPPKPDAESEARPKHDDGAIPRFRFNEVREENKLLRNVLRESTEKLHAFESRLDEMQAKTRGPIPDPTLDPQGYATFVSEGAKFEVEKATRRQSTQPPVDAGRTSQQGDLAQLEARAMATRPDYLDVVNSDTMGKYLSQREQAWVHATANPPLAAYDLLKERMSAETSRRESTINQGQVGAAQPGKSIGKEDKDYGLTENQKETAYSFYKRHGATRDQAYKHYSESLKQQNIDKGRQ